MLRFHARLAFALLLLAGCTDLAPPRILHPGSEEYQQTRAQRFDPYPLTDVAPDIVGGRPLQYIKPAPENERMQNEATFAERYHQQPPPGLYRPPRTSGNRQGILYPLDGTAPVALPPGAVQSPSFQAPVVQLAPGTAPPFSP
jgi:hypothetical protein